VATRVGLNLVRLCATVAHSIIPSLSAVVRRAFGDHAANPPRPRQSTATILDGDAGLVIEPIGRLVEKLVNADTLRLKRRFSDRDEDAPV
jgi:methionyl-tRNA synthetase